jgi:pimeloyl-ACP methyl ester carboxylesterase
VAGDSFGPRDGQPVLLLHGAGQTRHAWKSTGSDLAQLGYYVIALDARGHGDSDWAADKDYSSLTMIRDIVRVAESELDRPPVLVGASMGGLSSLMALGEQHLEGAGLVLVDIAHRMSSKGGGRVREFMDDGLEGFASLEEAADAIAEYQTHRNRPKSTEGLSKNLRLGADGRYRWHWDPDYRSGRSGIDPKTRYLQMVDCVKSLTVPTLLIRGGMSDVLPTYAAEEFCELAPHTEYVDIAGAAHMIVGDKNDTFGSAVVDFLTRRVPA